MQNALDSLEFPQVVTLIALEAKSDPGRRALAERRPQKTLAACELLQARLQEMVKYYQSEGLLPFAGLVQPKSVFQSESFGLPEAWILLRAVRSTQAVREALLRTEEAYPKLQSLVREMPDLEPVVRETSKFFTKDGKLREEASATLRSIRQRVHQKRAAIQRTLGDLMSRHSEAVQEPIVTIRQDRYCIPLRTERRNEVPGILHERSGSGASVFIEPIAIVEANNDLADLLIEEREEIARIVAQIARILFDASDDIEVAAEIAGELDATQACALFAERVEAHRPIFTTERKLDLLAARHPLIDERVADLRRTAFGEKNELTVVPLTLTIATDSQALVISGPNAGGKTVALKTAGLIIAMAMSGLPVPAADGTTIPIVDELHVLIGDDQNLLESLSTFSAYLVRLKAILSRATPHSLVLLDELGSGTDPEEGSALAAAVIEHVLALGALMIVTTHLTALKSFATDNRRIANGSMEYDLGTGRPTFRLIEGLPGRSRAIEAARHVGLPASLIESATSRLGDDYGKLDHLVADLQRKLHEATQERNQLELERKSAESEREKMRTETARLEEERKKLASRFRDEADRMKDEIGNRLQFELKRLKELDRKEREKVSPNEILQRVVAPVALPDIQLNEEPITVGAQVEHRKFKVIGKVLSIEGNKAHIAIGGKTMQVPLDDLRSTGKAPKKAAPQREERRPTDEEVPVGAELNLIGQRVDDALDESDKFLDRALLNRTQAVRLIHGFGTGTLRKALREHLRKHPAVRSFRPGNKEEGGDGATVALLDV